jgi:serine/threonine protein kinase
MLQLKCRKQYLYYPQICVELQDNMTRPGGTLAKGRYQIKRLLHRGGFGFIYLAKDNVLDRDVALKELIPALADDPATLKRFIHEARATSRLEHPNIVRTLNIFADRGNYHIVMEYLTGGSLEELLRERKKLPLDEAIVIATDLCAALSEAHSQGVYHCDLKPSNVLFDRHGVAKLGDFGIAHISDTLVSRSWRTTRNFSSGTLPYMAPEQLDGVRNDPRVDVYALGTLLYQMLSGQTYLQFDQRNTPGAQADNVKLIRHRCPEPLDHLPAEVNDVLMKALAKQPTQRYTSAMALRSALMQASLPYLTSVRAVMALSPLSSTNSRPVGMKGCNASPPDWMWVAAAAMGASLLFLLVTYVL